MTKILVAVFFLLMPYLGYSISPKTVVASSLKHAPQVLEALQNVQAKENMLMESEGAFDAKIKSKFNLRTDGFYNGDAYRAEIEKPLPFANSKLYAGGRQSFSDFPEYEGKYKTQSAGETFAGVSISLLRNFLIDPNRYTLRQREQDFMQAKISAEKVRIEVQTMALKSYWMWVVKGHEYSVFKNLLDLAQSRAAQISKRIKAGDLARIYGVENDQYIKKWEAEAVRSRMEFKKSAFYLSLFYRDEDGRPLDLKESELPKLNYNSLAQIKNYQTIYQQALDRNLDLRTIKSKVEQADLDVSLGKNFTLPQIDLSFEVSQDHGVGDASLEQFESRVKLNFEIPLQLRKGRGKARAGRAKRESLRAKRKLTNDKLIVESKSLAVKLNSYSQLFKVTFEQVRLAKRLASAERKKFFRGASDLILVNIRDENLAQAQIKNLSSRLKYQFVDADIKNAMVNFITN